VELFSHFIGRLKATADGEGTLLDRTMVVYGGAISDGDRHTHTDLPVVVAGGRDLGLSLGRHVVYPKKTPMTNLYLSLLDRAGVHPDSIGDSTGKLTQLGA
jgi:hypothetical protein